MTRFLVFLVALLILPVLALLAPNAGAQEIRDISLATEFVAAGDYLYIQTDFGASFLTASVFAGLARVTGPAGDVRSFQGFINGGSVVPGDPCGPAPSILPFPGAGADSPWLKMPLDAASSTFSPGVGSVTSSGEDSGDLSGTPADGTFLIEISGGAQVQAQSPTLVGCFVVGGKAYSFTDQEAPGAPSTESGECSQLWNRHVTASFFGPEPCGPDDPTEPDEDPDEARFFAAIGVMEPEAAGDPFAATGGSVITCPSTLTMNGTWARGAFQSLNTFVRFVSTQGFVALDTDLRDNVGASFTALTDDGALATGDHSADTLYNNAVGTSYQFLARNGSAGLEQLGQVVFAPAMQCDPLPQPATTGFEFGPDDFWLEVSQAQCNGDPVAFTLNVNDAETAETINVTVIDTETGGVALIVPRAAMGQLPTTGQPRALYFNRTLPAGPWAALALHDNAEVLVQDRFHFVAFNVPVRACVTDISGLFAAISAHNTAIINEINNVGGGSGAGGLLALGAFTDFTLGDSTIIVLFLILLVLSYFQRWLFVAITSMLGILDRVVEGNLLGFTGHLMLLVLGIMLQILADMRDARNEEAPGEQT